MWLTGRNIDVILKLQRHAMHHCNFTTLLLAKSAIYKSFR